MRHSDIDLRISGARTHHTDEVNCHYISSFVDGTYCTRSVVDLHLGRRLMTMTVQVRFVASGLISRESPERSCDRDLGIGRHFYALGMSVPLERLTRSSDAPMAKLSGEKFHRGYEEDRRSSL